MYKSGQSGNPSGRPKGAVNIITKTVKQTVLDVFNELQEDPKHNLIAFAKRYPRDFYVIAAKLIPMELSANIKTDIVWNEVKTYNDPNPKADISN